VDGCGECAAAAVSAGAVAATVDLLGQTTDPELLETTLTVRHARVRSGRTIYVGQHRQGTCCGMQI